MIPDNGAWSCHSQYVPVRDGTLLAAYVFRPRAGGEVAGRPLPAVWAHDRYHQVEPGAERAEFLDLVNRRLGAEKVDDLGIGGGRSITLRSFPWAEHLLVVGYVVVIVDTRGSGASFGRSDGPLSSTDGTDAYDVTEWIAQAPWCDGKVGMFGRSYLGVAQYLAMSEAPPHLIAVFPQMSLFDLYGFGYDGGIYRDDFARVWGDGVRAGDLDGPVLPLDDDPAGALLRQARAEHQSNRDVYEMFAALPNRDSRLVDTGEQPYLTRSPAARIAAVNASGVAVYHLGGWHDVWARDALAWQRNLNVPHRLVMGPWAHTGGIMGSHGYNLASEHVRWFDYWLKGIDNGVMSEPPIRYYAMGPGRLAGWRSAATWPPEAATTVWWQLLDGGLLSTEAPAAPVVGEYRVDYTTTTGRTSRWASGYGAPFSYGDLAQNDAKALCFTTDPLGCHLEIAGNPCVSLSLSCDAPDVDIFVYLEAVDAGGVSHYVTEGCLRAARPDAVAVPGAWSSDVQIDLHPVAYVFEASMRIRVAITGADRDNAHTPQRDPAPWITLRAGSGLALPVLPARSTATPLSTAQQAIWLADQAGMAGPAYHLAAAVDLPEGVDLESLWRALEEIVARHEALRTTIEVVDGVPVQRIHASAALTRTTLALPSASDLPWWEEPTARGYAMSAWDVSTERPVRVAVVTRNGKPCGLTVVVHHLAGDQDAASTFFRELSVLYAAFRASRPSPLPEPAAQYSDVVRRQQAALDGEAQRRHAEYWAAQLRDAPPFLALPTDFPGPGAGYRGASVPFTVDPTVAARIRELARARRTSVFGVLITAFNIMLATYSGQSDLVVAVPMLGRGEEHRDMIGCMVSLLPLRSQVAAGDSVSSLLDSVRVTLLEALEHRDVPFDSIARRSRAPRDRGIQPFAQVSIRMGRPAPTTVDLGGSPTACRPLETGTVKYDLAVAVNEIDGQLSGALEYRTALFTAATAARIAECFVFILGEITTRPDARVSELRKMSRKTLRLLLERWNPSLPAEARQLLGSIGVSPEPGSTRCYLLDGSGTPVPPGAPGELFVGGPAVDQAAVTAATAALVANPFTGIPTARMFRTRLLGRLTADGAAVQLLARSADRPHSDPTRLPECGTDPAATSGQVLENLRGIWRDLLAVAEVGADSDFFDLGGDSLLAIRLLSRIRKLTGVRMTLRDVFVASTLAAQAQWVSARCRPPDDGTPDR